MKATRSPMKRRNLLHPAQCLAITMAQTFSKDVAHITDGRFGGGSQYSLEFFAGRDKGLP